MYIDKPKKEFRGANLFFGALLIKNTVEVIMKSLNLFPISTNVSQKIESSKLNSELKRKPSISYMTPDEEMRYLISTNESNKIRDL